MSALRHTGMPISQLVTRARAGDGDAWRELVDRHNAVVWAVVRAHRLREADADDVVQNTWIALAQHIAGLRRPDRLPAWLATTARRECLRVLRGSRREVLADTVEITEDPPEFHACGEPLLWEALRQLPQRCRELLSLFVHAPDLTYVQVARALGIKVDSIRRTRGRCLDQLRHKLAVMGGDPR
ncbi:RNA polymerase sigma factor [Actinophytocola oryzae]|uniref:RNA polymerase sigma factor (Sigma-70 family) n=1 Tax=Actinophytocola oryzae TaxID=502181 RepID=A0A4R7VD73_9PSEU|nr:sigma-70 family RNA polymerase sigma factor [Actinophytocola oryzae]TDV46919.1 RNA polymerase sigma factor (sigma-70 family) [Actinophytocola oryzae]